MENILQDQEQADRGKEIYLIRHGERQDEASKTSSKFESPMHVRERNGRLTSKGEYQAFITGRALHSTYLPHTLDLPDDYPIFVLCSPYQRCIQTAFNLAVALKINGRKIFDNKIFIVDYLMEYRNEKNVVSDEELEETYNSLPLRFSLKTEKLKFPKKMNKEIEDPPKSFVRTREFLEVVKDENFTIRGAKPDLIVCVTHAFFLLNLMLQYGHAMEANSPIEYCSLNKIGLAGGCDSLSVVNSCDHLDDSVNFYGERSGIKL